MDIQRVYHRLRMMAGEGQEAEELLLMICSSAGKEIRNKVKNEQSMNDERLIAAAAGLAYYMLTLLRCGREDSTESFRAGDVSVTRNVKASLELAAKVRDSYLELAADLLNDGGFAFRKVTA